MRYCDPSNVLTLNDYRKLGFVKQPEVSLTLFLAVYDVLEEVDRDLLVCRKEHADIDSEEIIHFSFRLILGGELFDGDCDEPLGSDLLWVVLHVVTHDKRIFN